VSQTPQAPGPTDLAGARSRVDPAFVALLGACALGLLATFVAYLR
jgi:hypothetical protein